MDISMNTVHNIHVDFVRLLNATERLVAEERAGASIGAWEDWPRFCEFTRRIGELQVQLHASCTDYRRSTATRSEIQPQLVPSPEDLERYTERVEILRRRQTDLAVEAKLFSGNPGGASVTAKPTPPGDSAVADNTRGSSDFRQSAIRTTAHADVSHVKSLQGDALEARKGRRRSDRVKFGASGTKENHNVAAADDITQEISNMAGRLKESSMEINKTLRSQTRVLADTEDTATKNVDKVITENARVSDRLRRKRRAMFASWCMMIMVFVTFFATYIFVILPFNKRRGPFVAPSFAVAAEQPSQLPSNHADVKHTGKDASNNGPRASLEEHAETNIDRHQQTAEKQAGHRGNTKNGGANRNAEQSYDHDEHRQAQEEARRRAARQYEERSRQHRQRQQSDNAGLRFIAQEKEKYRQRQAESIVRKARERRTADGESPAELNTRVPEQEQDEQDEQDEQEQREQQQHKEEVGEKSSLRKRLAGHGEAGPGQTVRPSVEIGTHTGSDIKEQRRSASEGKRSIGDSADTLGIPEGETEEESRHELNEAGFQKRDQLGTDTRIQERSPRDSDDGSQVASDDSRREAERLIVEEKRRAYEEQARRHIEREHSGNVGLRMVAEEKERYRQRHSEKAMQRARERRESFARAHHERETAGLAASAAVEKYSTQEVDEPNYPRSEQATEQNIGLGESSFDPAPTASVSSGRSVESKFPRREELVDERPVWEAERGGHEHVKDEEEQEDHDVVRGLDSVQNMLRERLSRRRGGSSKGEKSSSSRPEL